MLKQAVRVTSTRRLHSQRVGSGGGFVAKSLGVRNGLWQNKRAPHQVMMNPYGLMFTRSFNFTKPFVKLVRIPGYIGGTMAAGGSYVAYKVDQMSNYTQDTFGNIKDFTSDWISRSLDFLKEFSSDKLSGGGDGTSETSGGSGGGNGGDGGGDSTTAVGGATAAAVAVSSEESREDNEDEELEEFELDEEEDDTNDQMLNLTKQMIEIRNLVSSIDDSNTLKLPSIIVIGSQSSGKSSVLESIVGHEFLPKGDNMVTKRPIELTLVNSPELAEQDSTIEFPDLRLKFLDFKQAQKILVDLNLQVPNSEFISNDPINLTIKSPKIPDLSLVDLPGYIQVESADQPLELKQKIRNLCLKYLEAPNVILAISAANVDLANSSALRAARLVDPRGERTLGVITKLDLVEPQVANSILINKKYPLRLGYVGVITKAPNTNHSSLFKKSLLTSYQSYLSQQAFETQYFQTHKNEFLNCIVSTKNLKRKLIKILEKSMTDNLRPTHLAIQKEFEETNYKFKVEFNDLPLTPQMYIANNLDILKLSIKELSQNFSKKELKSLVRNELDQQVLDLLAKDYWSLDKDQLKELQTIDTASNKRSIGTNKIDKNIGYWERKLDLISGDLTKLGVGRLSTNLITNALLQEVENLVNNTQLKNHPKTLKQIKEVANQVLGSKYYSTADQVENCIKPFKYEIEIEDREWSSSRENSIKLMKEEIKNCDEMLNNLKTQIGGRKLSQVVKYLKSLNNSEVDLNSNEALGFSYNLIEKGRLGCFLQDRLSLLKMRYQFLKSSSKCKSKENKVNCPEVYLDLINEKLTSTSILFLNVELLNDFYYNFPRELDLNFFNKLSFDDLEQLAKEDPKIEYHINLQKRKDLLSLALNKMESILAIKRMN